MRTSGGARSPRAWCARMLRTDIPVSAASCSIVSWLGDSASSRRRTEDTGRLYGDTAELSSQQLARRGARQLGRERDLLGHLERRQAPGAVAPQLVRADAVPGAQNHGRDHGLAPLRI